MIQVTKNTKEVNFYPEMISYLKDNIESNISSSGKPLQAYFAAGDGHSNGIDLSNGIKQLVRENDITIPSIIALSNTAPKLQVDMFGLVTDGIGCTLLIIEVKYSKKKNGDVTNVSLSELSQLIGYCIASNAGYGLLVNVDGGWMNSLINLVESVPDILSINRILTAGETSSCEIGIMKWDSMTQNMKYSNLGKISSLSKLTDSLSKSFE